jgi:hypothetical protein
MPAGQTFSQTHTATRSGVHTPARFRLPTVIRDRGQPVALLVAPDCLPPPARRVRQILPEYAALMQQMPVEALAEDLDAVRLDQ